MGERKIVPYPFGVDIDPLTHEWQYRLLGVEDDPAPPAPLPVTGDLCHVPGCLGGRRCPAHGEDRL